MSAQFWLKSLCTASVLALAMLATGLCAQSPWRVRNSGTTVTLWGAASAVTFQRNPVTGLQDSVELLVVVGEQGTILTSADEGATWTPRSSGTSAWLTAVAYSSQLNRYFAVGDSGTILSSADGVVWVREISPVNIRLNAVADTGNGILYAVGESGAGLLQRDANGNWTRFEVGFGNGLMRGLLASGSNCAVGQNGALFTPPVGAPVTATWQQVQVPTNADLESVSSGVARVGR